MTFKALFSLAATHAYHDGDWSDVEFVTPAETTLRLAGGRLLAKRIGARLQVLFEADDDGVPRTTIATTVLRFGLRATDGRFSNFTQLPADFASRRALYRNSAAVGALDAAATPVTLVPPRFRHAIASVARPVTLTLRATAGGALQRETVTSAAATEWACDLAGAAAGLHVVVETSADGATTKAYYTDAELFAAGVFALVEIQVAAAFYTAPAEFAVALGARTETLKYYVVAANGAAADAWLLQVTDGGAAADGRTAIDFDRVEAQAFGADDLAPTALGAPAAAVVLFKSRSPVARRAKGRTGIRLLKGADVLINNLPQPAAEAADANLILRVAKS